jgi:Putative phage serine protease XkdF
MAGVEQVARAVTHVDAEVPPALVQRDLRLLKQHFQPVREAHGWSEPLTPGLEIAEPIAYSAVWRLWKVLEPGVAWYFVSTGANLKFMARVEAFKKIAVVTPALAVAFTPPLMRDLAWALPEWDAALTLALASPAALAGAAAEPQSVVIPKDKFSLEEARQWLRDHDYEVPEVDETEASYRFRQFPPSQCIAGSYASMPLPNGITLVVCRKRETASASIEADPLLRHAKVIKADAGDEKRYALVLVYPADGPADAHGDHCTAAQLEEAAWNAMKNGLAVGIEHEDGTEGAGDIVESYLWPSEETKIGDEVVRKGDWLAGIRFPEAIWARIKSGEFTGVSLQGWAHRTPAPPPEEPPPA